MAKGGMDPRGIGKGPPSPPRGCEVFVGKIPRDSFEDELVPVFEKVGKIYEMRLMMEYSGHNRGYAFVVYSTPAEAKECVKVLNSYEIRKGRTLGVCMSVDNCRLFVGGIPKKVMKEDIRAEMLKVTEGVVDVIVYPSASDKTKNRGFAFIEYESHRAAAMARRKLMSSRAQLWGHQVAVDWAEPELEVDMEVMAQVKVLYVRNLMLSTTERTIEEAFSKHASVERVKKIRDYAFVHFFCKEGAHQAMQAMNGSTLEGAVLEVTLAKPVDKDTFIRSPKASRPLAVPAIGFMAVDYNSLMPAIYPTYYSPPKYLPRNSMGACMSPTGRASWGRGRGYYPVTFATSAPGMMYPPSPMRPSYFPQGAGYYDSKRVLSEDPFDHSASVLECSSATPPAVVKSTKSTVLALEEVCLKNNWGQPLYSLHSTGGDSPLYHYKVTIACLGTAYLPSKLSPSVEEAKAIAAEYTLIQLGYPLEASGHSTPHMSEPAAFQASYITYQSTPKPQLWAVHDMGAQAHPTAIYPAGYEASYPTPSYPHGQELCAMMSTFTL
ncbi:hypothetical protein EMCRGX_G023741 [Ephydatia muelleri]